MIVKYSVPIIGVQKPGSQYSPVIVVYTLHSIIMVLLYYIYLLGTYHWLLSLILSVHFRNWMHLNINIVNLYMNFGYNTRKLRKSPAFQFLVLAVNHFVLMAILNACNISIKHLQWYVYLVCYIHCIYSSWIRWTRFLHPYRIHRLINSKRENELF